MASNNALTGLLKVTLVSYTVFSKESHPINKASMLYTNLAIKVSSMVVTKGFDGAARRIGGAK
ncbi:MAG: hypothetical protein AAFY76_03405 [Cyanobacteria bacterium J06649_11]